MDKLLRYIFILFPFFLSACSDDIINPGDKEEEEGMPVELSAMIGPEDLTRGIEENSKKKFETGEVIHVEATFFDKENKQLGKKQYKTFEKESDGSWKQVISATMRWPGKAVKGKFKAYFVNDFQYNLEVGDKPRKLKLGDLQDDTDPLMAEKEGEWGQKINLKFRHICTHLTFKNLEPGVTDYFWLINKNSGENFHNGFQLSLSGNNELIGEFITIPDNTYKKDKLSNKTNTRADGEAGNEEGGENGENNEGDSEEEESDPKYGLVYVQSPTVVYDGENGAAGKVGFFLEPGDYSNIELRTINNYSYLSFKSDLTSNLLANKPYEIDIIKNKGVTFIEDNDDWDDDLEDDVYVVDPDDFLGCIEKGTDDYVIEVDKEGKTVKRTILKNTSSATILRYNVSFNKKSQKGFFEMSQGKYFDGGNHFISDIATNLFESNDGTIRHLWLKDAECNVTLSETDPNDKQNSQWGLLCRENMGVIDDVRMDDIKINFNISDGRDDERFTFDLGALTGHNSGSATNISFGGTIRITSGEQNNMRCSLNLGGFIGQNTGIIRNVNPMDKESGIIVKHSLKGEQANISCGGAAGFSSTDIKDVRIPRVTVDSSAGQGMVGHTGGLVGELRGTVGSVSVMASCIVSGVVKGFPVRPLGTALSAYSYTGGLAGSCSSFDVTDCRAVCDVELNVSESDDNLIYGTGGGFGRIMTAENSISNNYIWGGSLRGPSNYIGNFCGISPSSKKWEDYMNAGNKVKEIIPEKFVGFNID